jgi:Dolichyl-phosphate-mannose-protein mannosyltransferase
MTVISEAHPAAGTKPRASSRQSTTDLLLWIALAAGAVLRIARWWHWRALWLDEIYLARSITHRSLTGLLLHPLDDWQAAPAGFLAMVYAIAAALGDAERWLRLPSILFALASLPMMLAVSRRVLGKSGAVIALTAFSVLGPLIYYSNELKPYSCDVAASLVITLLALRWAENPSARRTAIAAIIGALAIFFSFPVLFVLAGAGMWMLWKRRERDAIARAAIIFIAWAVALAADYFFFIRPQASGDAHPHLVQYWSAQNAFMPSDPIEALRWLFPALSAIAASPGAMWLAFPDVALIGLIVGSAIAIARRSDLLLILAPLPMVLAASALHQYPFADRLALFFVPQYLILIAAAVESLWTRLPAKVAAVAIAGLIILPSADRAWNLLLHPPGREESLPIYQWVAQRYRPGDEIYLSHFAEPSFDYYRPQSAWPIDPRSAGVLHIQSNLTEPRQVLEEAKTMTGHRRVWVILIHDFIGNMDFHTPTITAFNSIGHPLLQHSESGAWAGLYDCTKGIGN